MEKSKCCGAEALIQVGGRYGCKKCENYCEIEKSKPRCEVCDLFECTCFCKCGLPHEQCVCDFKPEDFELSTNNSMKSDEEIKKEWDEFLKEVFNPIQFKENKYLKDGDLDIASWWLSKLHTLQEEYKKELIEKIEIIPKPDRLDEIKPFIEVIKNIIKQ